MENKIIPFDFYLLRRPLLSVEIFDEFLKSENPLEWLRAIYQNPILQEAIYVASPNLYQRFELWLKGEKIGEEEKFKQTLVKYLIRMCTRSTPYGLFAGCAVGQFDTNTAIRFSTNTPFYKHTRLDMNYLAEIIQHLTNHEGFLAKFLFFPNSSIYRLNNTYRYLYYEVINKNRHYSLVSVEASTALSLVLQKAEKGILLADLATILINEDVNFEEAFDFVKQLVSEQILQSELEPTTTGQEFQEVLSQKLDLKPFDEILRSLQKQEDSILKYQHAKQLIEENFSDIAEKDLFQTDLFFKTDTNTISHSVIEKLTSTLSKILIALNPPYKNLNLDEFKRRFYERYELQEIPLTQALDSELGLGYATDSYISAGHLPLIEDLSIKQSNNDDKTGWNPWKEFVLKKYTETLFRQEQELIVTDADIDFLTKNYSNTKQLPETFYVLGSILSASEQHLDAGDFRFILKNAFGPSGAKTMARFCHGNEELSQKVADIVQFEHNTNTEVIFAEIVHLPEERTGNILMRPQFRQHEIPYICQSSVQQENQIKLDDLMVSVKNNRVFLRSRKHNKFVIPRLTNAHNYHNGLGIYRFLCDLQYEYGSLNAFWHWANFKEQVFLPRVCYKNIILSSATWNIPTNDFVAHKKLSASEFCTIIKATFRLPKTVVLGDFDNELVLDLDNIYCQEILKSEFFKKTIVKLSEHHFDSSNCFVKHQDKAFSHEIIIPFKADAFIKKLNFPPLNFTSKNIKRNFEIGSEWFYVKLYCGEKTADEILQKIIGPFVEKMYKKGLIDGFFFIRYYDSDPHLRLRFRGNPKDKFYDNVLVQLQVKLKSYLTHNRIHQLKIDTYQREIERYGAENIELVEKLFCQNSSLVLKLMQLLAGDDTEMLRWHFGIKGIDWLLSDFGLTLSQKRAFSEECQLGFFVEFGIEKTTKEQLNQKFRDEQQAIRNTLASTDFDTIFEQYSIKKLNFSVDKLKKSSYFHQILGSIIHLFVNRLFISQQRQHELVLYHFLTRYYISEINREPKP